MHIHYALKSISLFKRKDHKKIFCSVFHIVHQSKKKLKIMAMQKYETCFLTKFVSHDFRQNSTKNFGFRVFTNGLHYAFTPKI